MGGMNLEHQFRHNTLAPWIDNLVRMVTSLKVMETRPKGRRKEFILLDQNFNTTLINSTSREVFIMVSSINFSIPKYAQCPLKWGDNLTTHTTYSFEALAHDLARFTIGLNFSLRSSLVADHNGKRESMRRGRHFSNRMCKT